MKRTSVYIAIIFLMMTAPVFAGEFQTTIDAFSYGPYEVPAFDGDASEEVNQNLPTFSEEEMTAEPYVVYGDLDELGWCTPAVSMLNQVLMPTEKRGDISSVTPSGWVQAKYDVVPAGWLYNRCHLIGYQLTGADLNHLPKAELAKDLITGTRFLNVGTGSTGMVGYENEVAAYLKEDEGNEVAYRVSPVFAGDNLVAYGVLMEGQSVASNDVEFCAFCYNVQPEIAIDYQTGESRLASALPDNKPISECTITAGKKAVYNGKERLIQVSIFDGDVELTEGMDYELVYSNNTLPGRATVQIAGIGSYKGTATAYFIIVPARGKVQKLVSSKTAIRVRVAVKEGVTGYQYAWRAKGKAWKTAHAKAKVRIIKNLKSKTIYQVRVRAYKTIKGKKWYGKWSQVKTVRTK